MEWDPEVESPAAIAVIGAGPVGIEAALYARFLGYDVDLFDSGRPARSLTRWHQRPLDATVEECTTPLGHACLQAQEESYQRPEFDRRWTGQEFAEEYLIPIAKSDLILDGVHINSQVIEISRLRTSLDNQVDLQERCNDEFRLLIQSRDRGWYTRRADLILDCRGFMCGESGWGPAGGRTIGAELVLDHVHRWLPGDPRFELRHVAGKQTILYGQSESAILFAREWATLLEQSDADLKLIWLIPTMTTEFVIEAEKVAAAIEKEIAEPKRFSWLSIVGLERVSRDEQGRWELDLLHADDSTVALVGDVFAPFANPRPTPSIGPELLSQELAKSSSTTTWLGWQSATHEPHYYRLGSKQHPRSTKALLEVHQQIRHLFALLGGRTDLNLYDHIE